MAKKVLIYDDDTDLLEVCSLILTARHYEVIVREKCTEVLNDVEQHRPDVILMDNWIPDIGGVKATQLLKNSSDFNRIPVIFFTANSNLSELAEEAGADFWLQKPFDITQLEDMVANAASLNGRNLKI